MRGYLEIGGCIVSAFSPLSRTSSSFVSGDRKYPDHMPYQPKKGELLYAFIDSYDLF
jgi:hypothetical protein